MKNPILETLTAILLEGGDASQFELPKFSAKGNCTKPGVDPDLFYEEDRESTAQAKQVCVGCPILSECLQWAMKHEQYGIFGGRTPEERQRLNGNKPVLDAQQLLEFSEDLELLLSSKSIDSLVVKYKVTNRTIYRWKKQLTELQRQTLAARQKQEQL